MSFISDFIDGAAKSLDVSKDVLSISVCTNSTESFTIKDDEQGLYHLGDVQDGATEYTLIGKENGRHYGGFRLVQMPGCCGICILTGLWVQHTLQSKGLGSCLVSFAKEVAASAGYTTLFGTDIACNEPSSKLAEAQNFKTVFEFTNARTDNDVKVWMINLLD